MMQNAAFPLCAMARWTCVWTNRGQSAAEWLQTAEEADIARVLKTYGEERFAKRIARAIVERNREPADDPHQRTGGSRGCRNAGERQIQTSRDPYLPGGAHLE